MRMEESYREKKLAITQVILEDITQHNEKSCRHRKNPISTEIDRKYRSIALQMLKGEKEESFCIFPQRRDFIHGDDRLK